MLLYFSDSTSKLVDVASTDDKENSKSSVLEGAEVSTPKPVMASQKGDVVTDSKKCQTAKKIASLIKNPSKLRPKQNLQSSQAQKSKPESVKRLKRYVLSSYFALNLKINKCRGWLTQFPLTEIQM